MKRLGASAVVLFGLAAVFCAPLVAQRGGGHGGFSGGGHAGFSGGGFRSGFSGSSRSFASAPRSFAYAPRAGVRYAPGGAYGSPAARPALYSNHRGRGYNGSRNGYGRAGYGYGAGAYVAPYYLGYPDFAGYDTSADAPAPQNYVDQGYAPPPPDAGAPDPGYAGTGYPYSGPPPSGNQQMAYASPPPQPAAPPEPEDAVTLIFKDGRSEQIHNYALTRTTLYITGKHVHEVPLEELDLPATEKVNREAGVDFRLPETK